MTACLGCGGEARRSSGYCSTCYHALWRRSRLWRACAKTDLSLVGALDGLKTIRPDTPVQVEAITAVCSLLDGLLNGAVIIHRNGGGPKRRGIYALAGLTRAFMLDPEKQR